MLYILDTNVLTAYRYGDPAVTERVLATPADQMAIAVTTIEEGLNGWYPLLRKQTDTELADVYLQIAQTVELAAQFRILRFDVAAIARYRELQEAKLNIGKMDTRIAAIALVNNATVVTRNLRDFGRVPGLVCENWQR